MEPLEAKKILIGDKEYFIKKTVRALIRYENISDNHTISKIESYKDTVDIFYCCFLAGGNKMEYDKFLDLIDDYPNILGEFGKIMLTVSKKKAVTP